MMTLLAKGLTWALGSKLLPLGLTAGLLVVGHQWWLAHNKSIEIAATSKCEAGYQLAKMQAQLELVRKQAADAEAAIDKERKITEELRHERQSIAQEFAAHKAAASADPRCLSDGVLKLLGGDGGPGTPR
jgi:hypothetical protein